MNSTGAEVRIWAIVPAAGRGRRMGGPKQVLPYRDSTITGAVVRTLIDADVFGVVVVTRTVLIDALRLPVDPRITIAVNDRESEMIHSIRIGLARLAGEPVPSGKESPATDEGERPASLRQPPFVGSDSPTTTHGIMVVPADMPTLSVDACRRCIDAYGADPRRIVIAAHANRRGHPIIFPFSMRGVVEKLDGGLNELPRRCPERVHLVEVDDPGVARDVDTVGDYERLQERAHEAGDAQPE